eukprot:jgi/Bigna1/83120/fgenesh1_pg.102_\
MCMHVGFRRIRGAFVKILESSRTQEFSRILSSVLEDSRSFRNALEASGEFSKLLENSRTLWKILVASGMFSNSLEGSRSSENFHAQVHSAARSDAHSAACSINGRAHASCDSSSIVGGAATPLTMWMPRHVRACKRMRSFISEPRCPLRTQTQDTSRRVEQVF